MFNQEKEGFSPKIPKNIGFDDPLLDPSKNCEAKEYIISERKIPKTVYVGGDSVLNIPLSISPKKEKKKGPLDGVRTFHIDSETTVKVFIKAQLDVDTEYDPVWFVGEIILDQGDGKKKKSKLLFSINSALRSIDYKKYKLPPEVIEAIEESIKKAEKGSKEDSLF